MSDVFLCYRRSDNPQTAWHLAHILNGEGYKTFLDTHILGGNLWDEEIQHEIASCAVFICFIGANWLERGDGGIPRIHDENDNVRKELELAIGLKKRILPILVGEDAIFPKARELPDSLKAITNIEFVRLRFIPPEFYYDAEKVTQRIRDIVREKFGSLRLMVHALYGFFRKKSVAVASSSLAAMLVTLATVLYTVRCDDWRCSAPDIYTKILDRAKYGKAEVKVGFREHSIPVSYKSKTTGANMGFMQDVCDIMVAQIFPGFITVKSEVVSNERIKAAQGRFSAIESGAIDIECGSTSITDKRQESFGFFGTHLYSQTRFASLKTLGLHDLTGAINFTGKRVNYVEGTTNREILNISGIALNDFDQMVENVGSEMADVVFTDDLLLAGFLSVLPKTNYVISRAGYGELEQYGILLPKNSAKMRERMQTVWNELSERGKQSKLCQLYRKHFDAKPIAEHMKRVYSVRSEKKDDDLRFQCSTSP